MDTDSHPHPHEHLRATPEQKAKIYKCFVEACKDHDILPCAAAEIAIDIPLLFTVQQLRPELSVSERMECFEALVSAFVDRASTICAKNLAVHFGADAAIVETARRVAESEPHP